MKNYRFVLTVIFAGFLMVACDGNSNKNHDSWSDRDLKEAERFCKAEMRPMIPPADRARVDFEEFCDCFTSKTEKAFPSWRAAMSNKDTAIRDSINRKCMEKALDN